MFGFVLQDILWLVKTSLHVCITFIAYTNIFVENGILVRAPLKIRTFFTQSLFLLAKTTAPTKTQDSF